MATRSRQYEDWWTRYSADHTDFNATGTTDKNTGFIILPPWVADKIELAGADLVDFFYGDDVPKTAVVEPARPHGCSDVINARHANLGLPPSMQLNPQLNATNELNASKAAWWEIDENNRQLAADKVRKYLSEEDIADIGFLHYLLSAALHLVNPLSGLCHSHEYNALLPMRNKYMTKTVADGRYCTLGQVIVNNTDAHSENTNIKARLNTFVYHYDVIYGDVRTDSKGLWFEYYQAEGVSLDGICKYAYDRITDICKNVPDRISRTGNVAKAYGDKGSIVIVPHMSTVLNVAYMLSQYSLNDAEQHQNVEGLDSAKERLLALIECIVTERKRWVGTHGCARDGLLVLYTRQL